MSDLQTATRDSSAHSSVPSPLSLPLVLIADADPDSRLRRARQLAERGFRVAVARTGFETIVKASCHLPDVILVDGSLGAEDVSGTARLLSNCPATAHIPIFRLRPGRRLPAKLL